MRLAKGGSRLLQHLLCEDYRTQVVPHVVRVRDSLALPLVSNLEDWSASGLWLDPAGLEFFCNQADRPVLQNLR